MKIVFDVEVRDVGKTPRWYVDIVSPHQWEARAVRGGVEAQFTFRVECSDGLPLRFLFILQIFQLGLSPLRSREAPGCCPGEPCRAKFSRNFLGGCLTSREAESGH